MANNTSPAPPTAEQIEHLVSIGFYVQALAGLPNLTMPAVMTELLARHNASSLNTTAPGDFLFGAGLDPQPILQTLAVILPTLSREQRTTSEMRDYLIMMTFAIGIVALRIYSRLAVRPKQMNKEDWACLVALMFVIMLTGCFCAQSIHRFHGFSGSHIYTLTLLQVRSFARYVTANEVVFHVTHFFVKMTFLVFYYRLNPERKFRIALFVVAFYVFGLSIGGVFVAVFQCKPIDWWNHFADSKCVDQVTSSVSVGIMFIVADFLILLLPIPAVWRLKLKTTDKLLVCGMFALGGLVSIISVIRVLALRQWLETIDLTWSIQKHAKWALLELDLSVMVSCAPAIKALLSSDRTPATLAAPEELPRLSLRRFGLRKNHPIKHEDETNITAVSRADKVESHTLSARDLERLETHSVKEKDSIRDITAEPGGDSRA